VLAEQHGAIPVGGHAIRTDVTTRGQTVSVIAAGPQNRGHLAVRSPLAHYIADHIAEPKSTGRTPKRTLDEREAAGKLFDLRILRNQHVERGVQPHDRPDAAGLFRRDTAVRLGLPRT
jgi:hypothetical protein